MTNTESNDFECPVCGNRNSVVILKIDSPELLQVLPQDVISIRQCEKCAHVFNEITSNEYLRILQYYKESYSDKNVEKNNNSTDTPGSMNEYSLNRYEQTAKFLVNSCSPDSKILDVGCAQGGFLNVLASKNFSSLYGIDVSERFLNEARKTNDNIDFRNANVENIPFPDSFFDVVILDQVLEHLAVPSRALIEIHRVLKVEGNVIFGVPNLNKYQEMSFFVHYWFLLKEHLQHFTIGVLTRLLRQYKFKLIAHEEIFTPILSRVVCLPNLVAVFEKQENLEAPSMEIYPDEWTFDISEYLQSQDKLKQRMENVIKLVMDSRKEVSCWGNSRELQYLLANTDLRNVKIKEIIDSNIMPEENASLDRTKYRFTHSHKFDEDSRDAILLVTAVAHSSTIVSAAKTLGFAGQIVRFDEIPVV